MITAWFLSLLICIAMLRYDRVLESIYIRNGDLAARQASHTGNPRRLGGFAIMSSISIVVFLELVPAQGSFAIPLFISVLPVFFVGLLEDWGIRMSPFVRLLAAILSSALVLTWLGAWVPRADIPGIDWAMSLPLFAISVTLLFAAGFCHAVNLIDGMNGLASLVVVTSCLGKSVMSSVTGQEDIMWFALAVASAVAGFLVVNWPVARLFLGDSGAYGLGHLVAWLLILLMWRVDDVTPPALLLVIFWPLADVLHTILRRIAKRAPVSVPDRLHLHQKLRRGLDIVWFGYNRRTISNPLTTAILVPMICAPVLTGVLLWNQSVAAWIALALYFLLFSAVHPLAIWSSKRWRK